MYHTAEEFEKAALAVFEYDQAGPGQIVGEPKKRLVRINPASPDIQDQMGFSFILDYPSRPQRGAWMSWNVRMKYG